MAQMKAVIRNAQLGSSDFYVLGSALHMVPLQTLTYSDLCTHRHTHTHTHRHTLLETYHSTLQCVLVCVGQWQGASIEQMFKRQLSSQTVHLPSLTSFLLSFTSHCHSSATINYIAIPYIQLYVLLSVCPLTLLCLRKQQRHTRYQHCIKKILTHQRLRSAQSFE